jgi:Mg/Co/Ni transporter MgtE
VYLSELLGRKLKDSEGRVAGRLRDVAVRVAGDELPEVVASLDDALAADAVEEMIDERQADVIEALDPGRAADILAAMAPDAAADVLAELEPAMVSDLLRRMGTTKAADLHALLTYPKDTAGGLMTTDYVMAPRGLPIGEATDYLRPQMLKPDWVYYIYVVEDTRERSLVGVISLRDLFLADPTQPVDDLMAPAPRRVRPDAPAATVAQIMSEYNLTALPVTNEQEQLLGDGVADLVAGSTRLLPSRGNRFPAHDHGVLCLSYLRPAGTPRLGAGGSSDYRPLVPTE